MFGLEILGDLSGILQRYQPPSKGTSTSRAVMSDPLKYERKHDNVRFDLSVFKFTRSVAQVALDLTASFSGYALRHPTPLKPAQHL